MRSARSRRRCTTQDCGPSDPRSRAATGLRHDSGRPSCRKACHRPLHGHAASRIGSTMRERVPPSARVSISNRPPASSTRRRTIARPTWPACTARLVSEESMPTPSSLTSRVICAVARAHHEVDAARAGVLDGVDDELLRDREQEGAREKAVVDRAVDGQGDRLGGRERVRSRRAATPRSPVRAQ